MRIDKNIWIMIGLGSIIFHMYLIFSGLIPNLVSRPIHMAFAIPWIFLYSEEERLRKFKTNTKLNKIRLNFFIRFFYIFYK